MKRLTVKDLFNLGKPVYRHKTMMNLVVGEMYEGNDAYGLWNPVKNEWINKEGKPKDNLDTMTVAELKDYAEANDIDLGEVTKKADILAKCKGE